MKVSVIVPIYNEGEYLANCLNSLVNQSLSDIEIIAVDDCSTDNSFKILKDYETKYPNKIRVFQNEKNRGVGYSRNVGLKNAKGTYIGFVDSDDYISKNMYEDMYNAALINNYPDIVTTRIVFTNNDEYLNMKFQHMYNGYAYNPIEKPFKVLEESPTVCNKIYLHSFIRKSQFLVGKRWEDVHFSYASLFNASKVVDTSSTGYFYRKIDNRGMHSLGYKPHNHLYDIFDILDAITTDTKKTGRYEKLQKEILLVQIKYILIRMYEVLNWKISEEEKEKIIWQMHKITKEKYIDWRTLNYEYLSSIIGILDLEKIENIINKKEKLLSENNTLNRGN